jgi:dUTP pyrophosphatase
MVEVAIVNNSTNPLPAYKSLQAAGMDIAAYLPESILLLPMQRILVPTGLHIALPIGTEAQLRPRSGLALNQGITLLNSPGTIDSDYRGEIKVLVINLSNEIQKINNGDRIAQLIIAKHETITWQIADSLADTQRGAGGFGHTGIK